MATCGCNCTIAVTEDGELVAWGNGYHGQLGLGAVLHQQRPARPEGWSCMPFSPSAWPRPAAVVAEDGALYICGDGNLRGYTPGKLGLGDGQPRRAATAGAANGVAGNACHHGGLRRPPHDGSDAGGVRIHLQLQRAGSGGRGR